MGVSRYRNVQLVNNDRPEYAEIFKKRGISDVVHYTFSKFKDLKIKDIPHVLLNSHIWTPSDRYYKLAHSYYGDSTYWWIIALFNNKPLETDVKVGDKILIPTPLTAILSAMEI
jgi:nucleoid-associated protein YgaU